MRCEAIGALYRCTNKLSCKKVNLGKNETEYVEEKVKKNEIILVEEKKVWKRWEEQFEQLKKCKRKKRGRHIDIKPEKLRK